MPDLVQLFWLFIRVNFLTTSGPASVGLLYKESVDILMTNADFVQAVSFSSILPGSDALQLAMFIGYSVGGLSGALVALLGSILPPTLLMLGVVSILNRLRRQAWVTRFVSGLTPAVSILMVFVALQIFRSSSNNVIDWQALLIAGGTLAALMMKIPVPLILLAAGLLGVFIN